MDGGALIVGDRTCKGKASVGGFGRQEGSQAKLEGDKGNIVGIFIPIVQYPYQAPLIFSGFGQTVKISFLWYSIVQVVELNKTTKQQSVALCRWGRCCQNIRFLTILLCRWKGERQNDITIIHNYVPNDRSRYNSMCFL